MIYRIVPKITTSSAKVTSK